MTQSVISEQTTRNPETLEKQGIPGQNKEKQNYDKSTFRVPRQDKRVDCIFPQRGAVLGQITAYKKARYYDIATNEVLEPKI